MAVVGIFYVVIIFLKEITECRNYINAIDSKA